MRLIDADNTLKAFAIEYGKTKELIDSGETQLDSLAEGFTEAAHIVKYIIPAVDAAPVVHCGSCRHADSEDYTGWLWCNEWQAASNCAGYCFKGERRADNGT